MNILKKKLYSFLFFLFCVNIKSSDDYAQEYFDQYTNEEEATPSIQEASNSTDFSDASTTKTSLLPSNLTNIEIIKNLQEKNKKLKKEISKRQDDLQSQNKSKREQKQNPALASKIKNDTIAIQRDREQISRNNQKIAQLQKTNLEPSLLGKLQSKKRKKRKPYCNPKITL